MPKKGEILHKDRLGEKHNTKEEYIKEVADKWKDLIDPRVYQVMYNYQVEITD